MQNSLRIHELMTSTEAITRRLNIVNQFTNLVKRVENMAYYVMCAPRSAHESVALEGQWIMNALQKQYPGETYS